MRKTKKIKIGNRLIGKGEPCFIIAEIGANHNQKIKQGKKLIDAAYEAGADAVKFQSFTVENWISKEMTSFPTFSKKKNIYKILKKCELPYKMYQEFQTYAQKRDLICFSTPSHKTDIDYLEKNKVPVFKFGSVQITDIPTIKYAALKRKPIILATGASNLTEVREAIKTIYSTGNRKIILLHCTSLYPTLPEQVNLRAMLTLKNKFNLLTGYSDHTLDPIIVPVVAVALGACVIEKHITLSRKLNGPDHPFAVEPEELSKMVKAIRDTEKILGSPIKRCLPEEKEIIKMGRRSIVSQTAIRKGDVILKNMLTLKRPGYGILPKFLDKIIGKKAQQNINKDKVITWKMIK